MADTGDGSKFVSPRQTVRAIKELWSAVRSCHFNLLFHRGKAKEYRGQTDFIDISSVLLAGVAGVGILVGFKAIPDWVWAVIAFAAGIVNQLRPSLRLSDKMVEELTLESEYASVFSRLQSVLDEVGIQEGLTPDLFNQLQLALTRFKFLSVERDKTDYKPEDTKPIQDMVNKAYPPNRLWYPEYALEEASKQMEEEVQFKQEQAKKNAESKSTPALPMARS